MLEALFDVGQCEERVGVVAIELIGDPPVGRARRFEISERLGLKLRDPNGIGDSVVTFDELDDSKAVGDRLRVLLARVRDLEEQLQCCEVVSVLENGLERGLRACRVALVRLRRRDPVPNFAPPRRVDKALRS